MVSRPSLRFLSKLLNACLLLAVLSCFCPGASFGEFCKFQKDAPPPPTEPSAGKALIIFIEQQAGGWNIFDEEKNSLYLDQEVVGALKGWSYCPVEVEPGQHLLWAWMGDRGGNHISAQWIKAEAGKTQYIVLAHLIRDIWSNGIEDRNALGAIFLEVKKDWFEEWLVGGPRKEKNGMLKPVAITDQGRKEAVEKGKNFYNKAVIFAGDPESLPFRKIPSTKAKVEVAAGFFAIGEPAKSQKLQDTKVHRGYLIQIKHTFPKKKLWFRAEVILKDKNGKEQTLSSKPKLAPAKQATQVAIEAKPEEMPWDSSSELVVYLTPDKSGKPSFTGNLTMLFPSSQKEAFETKQKVDVLLRRPAIVNGLP